MSGGSGRLAGRVALITGASRGIGAAVALRFAAEGAQLILVARTTGGLEETDDAVRALGGEAALAPFDLADFDAIDRLGGVIFERHRRLDILVANAGMLGTLTPLAHVKPAEWDKVMATNLTANWRLIRSLDPLLRASPSGRAIFVTSAVSRAPRAYWGSYAVSKAALDMLAGIYAAEVAQSNLRVNLIDPGRVRTRMRARAYPGEAPETLPAPADITDTFVDLAGEDCTRHGDLVQVPRR